MLSVIVPIFNGAHVLPTTLPAMLAQDEPAEWIFVDDGSTDDTRAVLHALFELGTTPASPSARIIFHATNCGRAAARNTGLKEATGEVVVFLDADAAPMAGFLANLQRAVEEVGAVAAIGRLEMIADEPADAYARYLRSPRRGPADHHALRPTPWKYFLTTASCVRADVLTRIGGFNESISYGEDLELAVRISEDHPDGLRYAPDAVVQLHDPGSLETATAKMREFGRDNLPPMVAAHPELGQWTGVDFLDSASGRSLRALAANAMLRPTVAKAVRNILPYLPGRLSNPAVRYLLGYTLANSYREGLKARQTR